MKQTLWYIRVRMLSDLRCLIVGHEFWRYSWANLVVGGHMRCVRCGLNGPDNTPLRAAPWNKYPIKLKEIAA